MKVSLNKKHLIDKIREKMCGRSLREVAPEIEISHSTLNRVLSGSDMETDVFCKLVSWLKIPVNDFFSHGTQSFTVTICYRAALNEEYASVVVKAVDEFDAAETATSILLQTEHKATTILSTKSLLNP